LGEDTEVYLEE
jgi:hypothetical protein